MLRAKRAVIKRLTFRPWCPVESTGGRIARSAEHSGHRFHNDDRRRRHVAARSHANAAIFGTASCSVGRRRHRCITVGRYGFRPAEDRNEDKIWPTAYVVIVGRRQPKIRSSPCDSFATVNTVFVRRCEYERRLRIKSRTLFGDPSTMMCMNYKIVYRVIVLLCSKM